MKDLLKAIGSLLSSILGLAVSALLLVPAVIFLGTLVLGLVIILGVGYFALSLIF